MAELILIISTVAVFGGFCVGWIIGTEREMRRTNRYLQAHLDHLNEQEAPRA